MNRYSKALKQLKSTDIDSKIKKLEETPTNNTKGVYSLNPSGYRVGPKEQPTQFFPKDDGTYPDGVPGTDGEAVYTRPAGYWDGGKNWESTMSYDANQDNIGDDGKNTEGLIDSDGTVKTFLPDGSRSFILGPLTDGFVLNHTSDAYTNIGYIQKDTREFVLLAKIDGQWESGFYSDSGSVPVWNGTSTGFTAHNENFTLAMAQWMRTEILANRYYSNLPYFYSGGVPQQGVDDCPTCPGGMKGGTLVGGGGDGSSLSGDGKGTGQTGKGSGDDVTTGDEHTQGDPTHGDVGDAGLWGQIWSKFKGKGLELGDAIEQGIDQAIDQGIDAMKWTTDVVIDSIKALEDPTRQTLDKFSQLMATTGGVMTGFAVALAADTKGPLKKWAMGGESETWARGGDHPIMNNSPNEAAYGFNLAFSLSKSQASGKMVMMDNGNVDPNIVGNKISKADIDLMFKTNNISSKSDLQNGRPTVSTSADQVLNPGSAKQPYMKSLIGPGFGGEGGSIMQPYIAKDGTIKILNTADKTLRMGGESGEGFDIETQTFTDIPSIPSIGNLVQKASDQFIKGMQASTAAQGVPPEEIEKVTKEVLNDPKYKGILATLQSPAGNYISGGSKGFINSAAAGSVLYSKVKQALGFQKTTELEKKGGHGHVRRQNVISLDNLKPEVKEYLLQKMGKTDNKKENYKSQGKLLTEDRQRILREIKKPFEVPEPPKKYKMNFKGKFTPQNTPDKTASKESDGLAATANMRGHKWSQEDKYWAGYETTETMNVIYDKVGHGEQAWNRMIEGARQKNGWKNREIIEQLNIIAHEKASRKVNPDYQSPWVIQEASPEQIEKEKNFDKVNKIKQIIGNTKRGDIKPEYPDEPAVKLAPNGYHPNYGKRYKHDKLDPDSAEAMPTTGNPEIDANVKKASDVKRKARKLKTLLGKMR